MSEPRRTGRKGRLLACLRIMRDLERDWRPYRSDWQPDGKLRENTKRFIAELRIALDELEASL